MCETDHALQSQAEVEKLPESAETVIKFVLENLKSSDRFLVTSGLSIYRNCIVP